MIVVEWNLEDDGQESRLKYMLAMCKENARSSTTCFTKFHVHLFLERMHTDFLFLEFSEELFNL